MYRYFAPILALCVAGCVGNQIHDDGSLQREAMAGTEKAAPIPPPLNTGLNQGNAAGGQTSSISTGSGRFVRAVGPAHAPQRAAGPGAVTFNFEDQPIQAVVKAILGDLLKQNYTIVPGVQGNISFSTSEPVGSSQALPILETLLSWTGNALVKQGGRYVVMPAKNAVAGNLAPSMRASAPAGGLQARLFPLHYVSAKAMEKLMKPFARPDAVLLADPGSNALVLSGTPEELANYQRTVASFDVDWMRGASVGVFNLDQASVTEVASQLDKMFGPKGDTPLAGMLRFIPISHTNSLVVISTQESYLRQVGQWIDKIDHDGGNEPQLYVYDVRNIQAADLASYLSNIYGSGNGNNRSGDQGGQLAPGLGSNDGFGNASGMGSTAGGFGSTSGGFNNPFDNMNGGNNGNNSNGGVGGFSGNGGGSFGSNNGTNGGNGFGNNRFGNNNGGNVAVTLDNGVRIAAADGGNQLLVRARPTQWHEIESAIKRLDINPLQVQIEARILEVTLTNQFQFGVQWYLQGLAGSTATTDSNGKTTITSGNRHGQRGALGTGGNAFNGADSFFYSVGNRNVQMAIHAMEESDNTKTLSAPSLVVMNNQNAYFQVGDEVPINTASLNISGNNDNTVNSAQYIQTGVILNVQPRVNPGGLVYMNIQQQVSNATENVNKMGNPTISQRQITTQVAVQSGQTVLLGGLISQNDSTNSTRVPLLGDIPILGWLFGGRNHKRMRQEIVVLLTPRVIAGPEDAKEVTNEYQDRLESMEPLRHRGKPAPDNSWMRP